MANNFNERGLSKDDENFNSKEVTLKKIRIALIRQFFENSQKIIKRRSDWVYFFAKSIILLQF